MDKEMLVKFTENSKNTLRLVHKTILQGYESPLRSKVRVDLLTQLSTLIDQVRIFETNLRDNISSLVEIEK